MDFKSFFKKALDTVEREVDNIIDAATPQQNNGNQPTPKPQPQQQPQHHEDAQKERTDAEWLTYFREILSKEFGQYAIRENVSVQELAGDANDEFKLYESRPNQAYKAEWGMPYTYVLYSGGRVSGVILLAKYQKQCRHVKFMISRMYAKKMGIPFISFYMDAPNEHDYVVERIKGLAR